ncbi:phage tail assembly chaperone family protein, TAC [Pseudomonas sp. R32]|uniref:phage tail assembly chaperone family protein, TAC n=1 Tax=Pseudomonas sp. R32 TaxID=1573704 RepID=UPI000FC139CA|nr:phage tail assembly chaperone family protein, TAC [Pseudomonas sp. R32]QHF27384.1 hypothetical protein PspR32_06045 [Pseudomonas sp. R32]
MNLNQLKAVGGIVDSQRVRKQISWHRHDDLSGEETTEILTLHVRRHSFGVIERLFAVDDPIQSRNARYIAASVGLGEEGEEAMSYDDAFNLEPALGFLILNAINEVNGTGNTPAKR